MAILITDSFTGTDGSGWNATTWPVQRDAGGVTSPASPAPTIVGNAGRMETGSGDRRYIAVTDPVLDNVDITVALTLITTGVDVFAEIGYRVGINLDSGTPGQGYVVQMVKTDVGGHVYLYKINSYDYVTYIHDIPLNDLVPRYWRVKAKASRHQVKWWNVGDAEPPTWKMDVLDTTYTTGRVFLGVYNNSTVATTIDWDTFRLEELVPPPPGIRVLGNTAPISAAYVGTEPMTAAFYGTEPIVIP